MGGRDQGMQLPDRSVNIKFQKERPRSPEPLDPLGTSSELPISQRKMKQDYFPNHEILSL